MLPSKKPKTSEWTSCLRSASLGVPKASQVGGGQLDQEMQTVVAPSVENVSHLSVASARKEVLLLPQATELLIPEQQCPYVPNWQICNADTVINVGNIRDVATFRSTKG